MRGEIKTPSKFPKAALNSAKDSFPFELAVMTTFEEIVVGVAEVTAIPANSFEFKDVSPKRDVMALTKSGMMIKEVSWTMRWAR